MNTIRVGDGVANNDGRIGEVIEIRKMRSNKGLVMDMYLVAYDGETRPQMAFPSNLTREVKIAP